jgi:hypothetical protein
MELKHLKVYIALKKWYSMKLKQMYQVGQKSYVKKNRLFKQVIDENLNYLNDDDTNKIIDQNMQKFLPANTDMKKKMSV